MTDDYDRSVSGLALRFEHRPAEELVLWALEEFGSSLTLASSFGAEDVVLIDMLASMCPEPRVFTIDTGRLPSKPLFTRSTP